MATNKIQFNPSQLDRNSGKSRPLYRQISSVIRKVIETGQLQSGDYLPGRAALVQCFDVEYKTVNAALDILEQEGFIQFDHKEIRVTVQSKHIVPQKARNNPLVYVQWVPSAFNIAVSKGCRRFAQEVGLEFVSLNMAMSLDNFAAIVDSQNQDIPGFVIIPWDFPEFREIIRKAKAKNIKMVFADRELPAMDVSSVAPDHYSGAYKATEHLLEEHDGPVYYVGSTSAPGSCRSRYEGWSAAMADHGFIDMEKYICQTRRDDKELSGIFPDSADAISLHKVTAMNFFHSAATKPYVIFTSADNVARGVYEAALDLKLVVGRDIFISGYGDKPFCIKLPVPLTSVFCNDEKLGYEAMRVLYDQLMGGANHPIHRVLPVDLRIRQSSIGLLKAKQKLTIEESLPAIM